MDLSTLGSTLPSDLADAERDMGEKFRAAALSITTLYKSSLGATKQAFHSGYSACLSDVLSTVQSSIASGQDASQTLSRLMDWVEGREAAMAAFAADELDEPSSAASASTSVPPATRRAATVKNALSHLQAPARSSSAPVPDHTPHPGQLHTNTAPAHSTPQHPGSNSLPSHLWQPTPTSFASSSPSTPGPSMSRPPLIQSNSNRGRHRQPSHSPVRTSHRVEAATLGHPPSSSFNPTLPQLPNAGVPFVSAPGPNIPIGSKRPLLDIEMTDESAAPPRSTPSRSSKRRSMGGSIRKDKEREKDEEGDGDRDKRRGGRRGHGGHGAGSAAAGL
ncbi:hypothetical protein DB88DRAFT_482050 [Papiliotrema laurentii]|uniref:Uncharacterized protein n=1 Tax=Papiliotrema laurentii TaxID=5418 RepID=A0AAD9FUJ0_PAPLA|nr:hypothetical protein DB88DRAFT_482050 [Papiliotrema laurentii]